MAGWISQTNRTEEAAPKINDKKHKQHVATYTEIMLTRASRGRWFYRNGNQYSAFLKVPKVNVFICCLLTSHGPEDLSFCSPRHLASRQNLSSDAVVLNSQDNERMEKFLHYWDQWTVSSPPLWNHLFIPFLAHQTIFWR